VEYQPANVFSSFLVPDEEEGLAAERDGAKCGFGCVVVGRDFGVVGEARQLGPVLGAAAARYAAALRESAGVPVEPAEVVPRSNITLETGGTRHAFCGSADCCADTHTG
jgi:hypothetical protein